MNVASYLAEAPVNISGYCLKIKTQTEWIGDFAI